MMRWTAAKAMLLKPVSATNLALLRFGFVR